MMRESFIIILAILISIPVFGLPTDGSPEEHSEYTSLYASYEYTTWGAGTEEQPYGSTIFSISSDEDVLYVQAAIEGCPVRTIDSLGTCSSRIIVMPESVTSVSDGAFEGCGNLETVYFLGNRPEMAESSIPFIHLDGTTGWNSGESVPLYVHTDSSCSFDYYVIENEATVHSYISGECASIPSSTDSGVPFRAIGDCAFTDTEITSLHIAEGIRDIGTRAFYKCWELKEANYPSSLVSFQDECFRECMEMKDTELPNVSFIGFEAFRECRSLTSLSIPESVSILGDGAFYLCRSIGDVNFGGTSESVPPRCFGYCDSLTEIKISGSVKTIGYSAFIYCKSLRTINLSYVLSVGDSAFGGCTLLDSVTDLKNIHNIGKQSFSDCRSLISITLADTLISIGDGAFEGCRFLESLTFEGDMPAIGTDAVPEGVTVMYHSSHADSWSEYTGTKQMIDDGGNDGNTGLLIIIPIAVCLCIIFALVIRKRVQT